MNANPHIWNLIALEALLVWGAIFLGKLVGQSPWSRFAWTLDGVVWGLAGTVPLVAALAVCLVWPKGPWRSLVQLVDEMLAPLFRGSSLLQLTLAAALAGIGEELLFRGVIQDAIAAASEKRVAWPPALVAVPLASLLFGLAHSVSRAYVVFATLVGLFLGCLYLAADNLLAPMIAHALYDLVALVHLARFRRPAASEANSAADPNRAASQ